MDFVLKGDRLLMKLLNRPSLHGGGRRGGGGHSPPASLSRGGRHFEGRKYGILKIGHFWQIDVCITERAGS